MAKHSKKSKSKRVTLKQKYKVIKKVKQHHQKLSKQAKKKQKAGGGRKKPEKDPGIPKQWPFKEELIAELEAKKQHILAAEALKKEQRKRAREEAKQSADGAGTVDLQQLQAQALNKQQKYEVNKKARLSAADSVKAEAGNQENNSRRAFYKEFLKVVEAADVVIQVLDARDPLACRCPDVERFIRRAGHDKKIILLLNKIDLVPREVTEQWLRHLREELPTVAFKCSTQKQGAHLAHKRLPAAARVASDALGGAECLGAEMLLQLLKNYARNANLKTAITVGVIGLPNVGKSSLINSLKRTRVAAVGNTPGVTRQLQEVHLDKHVKLLDSPGIVFSTAADGAAALRNVTKVEKVEDPVAAVADIVARCPAKQLMALYKVPAFEGAEGLLQHIAAARGKLKKGGTVDIQAAARIVLQDWNDGRIQFYTLPPAREAGAEHAAAEVATTWGKDFNADEVFANERSTVIAGLPSLDDGDASFFQTLSHGAAAVDLAAMETGEAEQEEEEDAAGISGEENAMDDEDGPSTAAAASGRGRSQTEALFTEEGQFNPHLARAERKRQRKQKKSEELAVPTGNEDYDFDDFAYAVDTADGGSGSESEGDENAADSGEEEPDEDDAAEEEGDDDEESGGDDMED